MYPNRFKDIRIAKGMAQGQVADDLNLSVIAIQNYKKLRRKPAYGILIALADYFDVSLDYLVGRTDNPENR